jgi:hypothetical protein
MTESKATESKPTENKPTLYRSWYDYNWDWVLISLFSLLLLAGIVLWANSNHPRTAAIPEDATTGQSTQRSFPNFPE